ncbi:hypothetical protein [Halodesulfurarchaeum sp.]|uniref:hypothetical protein n=1 Tax=Halodesulfurarchaeum sp. TaxID=1980530 RepID=UPI002FC2B740
MSSPGPSDFDDSGILEDLSPHDEEGFTEEFKSIYSEIDENRVREHLKNSVIQPSREKIETVQSLVGGFHPRMASRQNGASEFEFEFLSPLSEIGEDGGDILLARADYRSLHLAIIAVEIGGESKQEWIRRINHIGDMFDDGDIRSRIRTQLGSSSRSIETIQYVTLSREVDLAEFEYSRLAHLVEVDDYAVWERNRSQQTFNHSGGRIAHQDLTSTLESGLNYGGLNAPSIKFLIGSFPVLALEEMVFDLIYMHEADDDDHPQEFTQDEFQVLFESMIELGAQDQEYDELIENEVNRVLDFGLDIGMLSDDPDEINSQRDFDIKFQGEKPPKAKEEVVEKFLKTESPRERGRRAFSRTRENFEPDDSDLDDFL